MGYHFLIAVQLMVQCRSRYTFTIIIAFQTNRPKAEQTTFSCISLLNNYYMYNHHIFMSLLNAASCELIMHVFGSEWFTFSVMLCTSQRLQWKSLLLHFT